jgi:hypothetical protein
LSSYSHPQQPKGGSTTPLASLQSPSDRPPPTRSQQIGGPAELWALPPTTRVPDPPSARSDGWMAPSPRSFGASTPSHFPHQLMPFVSMGGEWHSPHHFMPFASTMYSLGWLSAAADRGDTTRLPRDDGALARYHRGSKAITKLGPSFLANSIISLPPTNNGGERRLGGKPCYCQGIQHLAYLMSSLRHADAHPWGVDALNAVTLELQYWYQRHSIR